MAGELATINASAMSKLVGLMRFYWGILTRDDRVHAAAQWNEFLRVRDVLETKLGTLDGKRILDLGCGRFYPMTLLFSSSGRFALGIDTAYMSPQARLFKRLLGACRIEGTLGLGKEIALTIFRKERNYRANLRGVSGFDLQLKSLNVARMDAQNLALSDDSFDAVVSIATLEHIRDVRKVAEETYRVLCAGGVSYHAIHLFPSLSGGHHPCWEWPDKVVRNRRRIEAPPWDHLRARVAVFDKSLNGLRKQDYANVFSEVFDKVEFIAEPDEGAQHFLTPDVRSELRQWSDEDLLTRTLVVVCQKA
jgi:SAM-dependent methyltransferase